MLKLKLVPSGTLIELHSGVDTLTIGRADSNDLVIDDPHVSALHGQIAFRGGGYSFHDLKSTNGSAVERSGKRTVVEGLGGGFPLQQGDRLLLGSETEPVTIEVVSCEGPPPAADPAKITVVATRQMVSASEVSSRIESSGRTLVPFLALSEKLADLHTPEEAFSVFATAVGKLVRTAAAITIVDSTTRPVARLWCNLDGKDEEIPDSGPTKQTDEISLVQAADGALLAWIPVDVSTSALIWAVVRVQAPDLEAAEIDSLSLSATLLGGRLRHLRLVTQIEDARAQLSTKNRYLREKAEARASETMIGQSAVMASLHQQIQAVALSDATVLILGQSGSGKELVAREIHRLSLRHNEIFAAVNCGALVESLLETELFGCKKGAFTGAHKDREGLFEVAHNGTLFLDEIGEMSPGLQVKLLRVLESGEVVSVGATRPRRVNVRVVTATNRDLAAEVKTGRFREDLYYRIHVFPIRVPSLSERREDIPLLVRHFLQKFSAAAAQPFCDISAEALRLLCTREYAGNVRQLANEVHRAVLLSSGHGRIEPEHLALAEDTGLTPAIRHAGRGRLKEQMARVEQVLIQEALDRHKSNRTYAAKELGITRQALLMKLNRHKLEQ